MNLVTARYDAMNRQAKEHSAALVARWREAHPDATCTDKVALLLAEMDVLMGRL